MIETQEAQVGQIRNVLTLKPATERTEYRSLLKRTAACLDRLAEEIFGTSLHGIRHRFTFLETVASVIKHNRAYPHDQRSWEWEWNESHTSTKAMISIIQELQAQMTMLSSEWHCAVASELSCKLLTDDNWMLYNKKISSSAKPFLFCSPFFSLQQASIPIAGESTPLLNQDPFMELINRIDQYVAKTSILLLEESSYLAVLLPRPNAPVPLENIEELLCAWRGGMEGNDLTLVFDQKKSLFRLSGWLKSWLDESLPDNADADLPTKPGENRSISVVPRQFYRCIRLMADVVLWWIGSIRRRIHNCFWLFSDASWYRALQRAIRTASLPILGTVLVTLALYTGVVYAGQRGRYSVQSKIRDREPMLVVREAFLSGLPWWNARTHTTCADSTTEGCPRTDRSTGQSTALGMKTTKLSTDP